MVAYSFQKRFVSAIETDEKLQTVRGVRKRHARRGEDVQLYTGMRTKHCRLIGVRRCLSIHPIIIDIARAEIFLDAFCPLANMTKPEVTLRWDGHPVRMQAADVENFARRDGFRDFAMMSAFWKAAHPDIAFAELVFQGVLIRWLPSIVTAGTAIDSVFNADLDRMGLR